MADSFSLPIVGRYVRINWLRRKGVIEEVQVMSGHSKWHDPNQHKKAANGFQARGGASRACEGNDASRTGSGEETSGNIPASGWWVQKAKPGNMPADNIKRAIMRGTGETFPPWTSRGLSTTRDMARAVVAIYMHC